MGEIQLLNKSLKLER